MKCRLSKIRCRRLKDEERMAELVTWAVQTKVIEAHTEELSAGKAPAATTSQHHRLSSSVLCLQSLSVSLSFSLMFLVNGPVFARSGVARF